MMHRTPRTQGRQLALIEHPGAMVDWQHEAWLRIKARPHFAAMTAEQFNACSTRRAVLAGYAKQLEHNAAVAQLRSARPQCFGPGRAHHHAPWGTA